jgi:hypothetical protein
MLILGLVITPCVCVWRGAGLQGAVVAVKN